MNKVIVFIMLLLFPALSFSQTKNKKIEEQDVKELEELIEGKKKEESVKVNEIQIEPKKEEIVTVEEIKPEIKKEGVSSVFHKTLGNNISISGTDQSVIIKTGTSTIIVDQQGKVQIHSAQSVTLQPEEQKLAKEEIKESDRVPAESKASQVDIIPAKDGIQSSNKDTFSKSKNSEDVIEDESQIESPSSVPIETIE